MTPEERRAREQWLAQCEALRTVEAERDEARARIAAAPRAVSRFSNAVRYRTDAHDNQRQLTPAYVLDPLRARFGPIGLDPCTEPDNPTNARLFFTATDDGLARDWCVDPDEWIFVNPPYSKAREPWVRSCIAASNFGHRVVLLMPSATDTAIFQRAALWSTSMFFISGRLKFGVLRENRRQEAASHPSALIGFNADLSDLPINGFCTAARLPLPPNPEAPK